MKKVKFFFTVLLCIVLGALIVRVFISTDKSVYDDFVVTDSTKTAYAESGKVTVKSLDLKSLISEAGYFSAYTMYFVEETGEIQVAVRYNESALGYTDTDSNEDFDFRLLIRDKNAEKDDISIKDGDSDEVANEKNDIRYGGKYYTASHMETKSRYGIYQYRRLTFSGVDMSYEEIVESDMLIVMTDKDAEVIDNGNAASYAGYYDRQYIHKKGVELDPIKVSEKKLKR